MAVSKLKRLPMTMIEVLIAIGIIAMIASLLSFNVVKAVRQQQFFSDVAIVTDQLRLAQDLMLIMPADFHVILEKEKEGFRVRIETDANLTQGWAKELKRTDRFLKGINYAKFEDQLPYPTPREEIDIRFQSGGSSMSKGLLTLSRNQDGEGPLTRTICLYGYPHPIVSVNEPPCQDTNTNIYDERLTSITVDEVMIVDMNYGKNKPKKDDKKPDEKKK